MVLNDTLKELTEQKKKLSELKPKSFSEEDIKEITVNLTALLNHFGLQNMQFDLKGMTSEDPENTGQTNLLV